MTDHSPITPPPELVKSWLDEPEFTNGLQMFEVVTITTTKLQIIATQAARWAADQELEACCEWLEDFNCSKRFTAELRGARRPKPPSLKEQALKALDSFEGFTGSLEEVDVIRRALEQLDD